jgi:hypothetical protein
MELLSKIILFILIFSILQLLVNFISEEFLSVFGKNGFFPAIQSFVGTNTFHHLNTHGKKRKMAQAETDKQRIISDRPYVDLGLQNSYYFLNNITSYQYQGIWNNSIPTKNFQSNSGKMLVSITKNNTSIRNFIENIESYEVLYLSILMYDGSYIDHWMNFTFNIHLNKDFSKGVNSGDITIVDSEITLSRVIGEFNDQMNFTSN